MQMAMYIVMEDKNMLSVKINGAIHQYKSKAHLIRSIFTRFTPNDYEITTTDGVIVTGAEAKSILFPDEFVFENSKLREKTDDDRLDEERTEAKDAIKAFAIDTRLKIVDGADAPKIGLYNARATLAREIKAGTASDNEITTALSSKYAKDHGITDPKVLADIWISMNLQMLNAGNTVDEMEKSAILAVDQADRDQLKVLLADLKAGAESALPQFLGIING